MSIRCGCAAASLQAELDRLEREDPAVARAVAGMERTADYIKGRLPSDQIQAIYNPPERPWETTLGPDDLT